jgi:hypothetical protein
MLHPQQQQPLTVQVIKRTCAVCHQDQQRLVHPRWTKLKTAKTPDFITIQPSFPGACKHRQHSYGFNFDSLWTTLVSPLQKDGLVVPASFVASTTRSRDV